MSRHTPGPWTIHQEDWIAKQYIEPTIWGPTNEHTGISEHVAVVRIGLPETEANARLIAAAPDLLALLHAVARSDRTLPCWCPIVREINRYGHSDLCAHVKAVIARVEGP